MKLLKPTPLSELAEIIQAEIVGDAHALVTGINEIHKVESGDLMFVDVQKYFKKAFQSAATFILINEKASAPVGKHLLVCSDPFSAYNQLVAHFAPSRPLSAQISESAEIHPTVILEPNVVIGHQVKIGAGSYIRANTVIHEGTVIGKNVIIQSGSVLGTDAFYFKKRTTQYEKMNSCGRVVIEDNVEIGSCCTIDRGVSGDTVIGEGSKLDNQVHVAHGVVIGKHCVIAAQVGIAGKTILKDGVKLWGQVGVAPRLHLEEGVEVYAQSGVSRNLAGGQAYFGSPAIPAKDWFSEYRAVKRLPREVARLRKLME